jgi:hypothetical protein
VPQFCQPASQVGEAGPSGPQQGSISEGCQPNTASATALDTHLPPTGSQHAFPGGEDGGLVSTHDSPSEQLQAVPKQWPRPHNQSTPPSAGS